MDRGAWQATVHGVAKELDTTEQLSTHAHTAVKAGSSDDLEPTPAWPRNSPPRGAGWGLTKTMVLLRASQLPRKSSMLAFLHGGEGKPMQHTPH